MTAEDVANEAARLIIQGMVVADDQEAFWLDLFNRIAGFCEAGIGEEAARRVIFTLQAATKH